MKKLIEDLTKQLIGLYELNSSSLYLITLPKVHLEYFRLYMAGNPK